MENWQIEHITANLGALINHTTCNFTLMSFLRAEKILSKEDVQVLESKETEGQIKVSSLLYDILQIRAGAYEKLTKALCDCRQSGALIILLNGFQQQEIPHPLALCNIPIDFGLFRLAEIEVQGKKLPINEIFLEEHLEEAKNIFKSCLDEVDYFQIFCERQKTFNLSIETLPPKPSFYLSRSISNRVKLDEKLFKLDCPDIFVFKDISRAQLTALAKPNYTSSSNSQLGGELSSRFIHLDDECDWELICDATTAPVHLIRYEHESNSYILEKTTSASDTLREFASSNDKAYVSEDEFLAKQEKAEQKSQKICICDKPGMGKSLLLAQLAFKVAGNHPESIVAFISFFELMKKAVDRNAENALVSVLNFISGTAQGTHILTQLLEKQLIKMELFFDGFDELPTEDVELAKGLLVAITTKFPTAKVYVTSRPHMRLHLENTLSVIAYDIMPFNKNNQVDFLVKYWQLKLRKSSEEKLKAFAKQCVDNLQSTIRQYEQDILGIPLQCFLLAENNIKLAGVSSEKLEGEIKLPSNSVFKMYQTFMEDRLSAAYADINTPTHLKDVNNGPSKIKSCFVWFALQTIYPQLSDEYFRLMEVDTGFLKNADIFKCGILQQRTNNNRPTTEFVHRTFAEYLVAEFFTQQLTITQVQGQNSITFHQKVLKFLFETILNSKGKSFYVVREAFRREIHSYEFNSFLLPYFMDGRIKNLQVENFNINLDSMFVNSCEELYKLLSSCLVHNLESLFKLIVHSCKIEIKNVLTKSELGNNVNAGTLFVTAVHYSSRDLLDECYKMINKNAKDKKLLNVCAVRYGRYVSPMEVAVKRLNYDIVEFLAEKINLKDNLFLFYCVEFSSSDSRAQLKKRIEILELLLQKNEHILSQGQSDIRGDHFIFSYIYEYPLVANEVHLELVKLLIRKGADINAKRNRRIMFKGKGNIVGVAAGHMSSADFHELVRFILTECQAGHLFEPFDSYNIPLHSIIRLQKSIRNDTLELIWNTPNFDPNITDGHTRGIFHIAAGANNVNAMKKFKSKGLDEVNKVDSYGNLPIHLCGGYESFQYLVGTGADILAKNQDGDTVVHTARNNMDSKSFLSTVKFLVGECRAESLFGMKNNNGQTCLHIWRDYYSREIEIQIQILSVILKTQSSIIKEVDNDGENVLFGCCRHSVDGEKCIAYLIEQGADFLLANKKGQSILHVSVKKSKPKVVGYLMSLGMDPHFRDNEGKSPIDIATSNLNEVASFPILRKEHEQIISLLKKIS